jgi:hypothetical protein
LLNHTRSTKDQATTTTANKKPKLTYFLFHCINHRVHFREVTLNQIKKHFWEVKIEGLQTTDFGIKSVETKQTILCRKVLLANTPYLRSSGEAFQRLPDNRR